MAAANIGELLLAEGVLTAEDIRAIIDDGGWKGTAVAKALQTTPHIRRADLVTFLGSDYTLPGIDDLRDLKVAKAAVNKLPGAVAKRLTVLPFAHSGGVLLVAALDSIDAEAVAEIAKKSELRVKVFVADSDQLRAAVGIHIGGRKAEIPPPKTRRVDTARRRATPPAEAVPLISGGDEMEEMETLELEHAEEVAEVVNAVLVPAAEFEKEARDPAIRLALEFDAVHFSDQPVSAIRVN